MIRHVIIDRLDRIVKSEYTYQGETAQSFTRADVPKGGAFVKMADTHEDYRVPVGQTIIP